MIKRKDIEKIISIEEKLFGEFVNKESVIEFIISQLRQEEDEEEELRSKWYDNTKIKKGDYFIYKTIWLNKETYLYGHCYMDTEKKEQE